MLTNAERVMKARTGLIINQPFFGLLAMNLRIVEDEACFGIYPDDGVTPEEDRHYPTFSTNGTDLTFHPKAPEQYTDLELQSVVAHEVMHLAGKHHIRLAGRDPDEWNNAADFVVNGMLKEAGFVVPEDWYYDPKYTGLSVDEIYATRHKEKSKTPDGNNGNSEQKGKTGSSGAQGTAGAPGGNNNSKQPQQSQQPQQNKQPGNVSLPKNPDPKKQNQTPTPNDLQQEDQRWTQLVSQAKTASDLTCGNIPGGIKRMVEETLAPKVDWRNVLREFIDRECHNDYTFTRPNQRYIHTGIILPTLYNKEVGRIAVAIDSSGSVSQGEISQFASEISTILEEFNPQEVAVFDVDTRMHGDEPALYTKEDLPVQLDIRGGGRTRFSPAFNWIEANKDKYDDPLCLIYLTDMGSSDYPDFTPDYPVLWVNTRQSLYSQPPFGEIIYMNR